MNIWWICQVYTIFTFWISKKKIKNRIDYDETDGVARIIGKYWTFYNSWLSSPLPSTPYKYNFVCVFEIKSNSLLPKPGV